MTTTEAIIIRKSDRGFRVSPPYRHKQFIAGFKRTAAGRWYADSSEWFIPAEKLDWAIELLRYWFKMPVAIEQTPAPEVTSSSIDDEVADERAALVADVKAAWHRARPFAAISWPLRQIFGVTELAALNVEQLKQVYGAITRHDAPPQTTTEEKVMSEANATQLTAAPVAAKLPHFTINFEMGGFPITAETECKAESLPAIIEKLKAIGATAPAAKTATAPAAATKPAGVPVCPVHNAPMKASRKPGSYFCPKRDADGDYCPEKA